MRFISWLLLPCLGLLGSVADATTNTTAIPLSECECDVFNRKHGTTCNDLEEDLKMDCGECECVVLANTNITATAEKDCTHPENQIGFYISLGGNVLLTILTFVSEIMGANKKTKFNGIVDAMAKAVKKGTEDI